MNIRSPFVPIHRSAETVLSNVALVVPREASCELLENYLSHLDGKCGALTRFVQLFQHLIMLPTYLGPFCKLVLTARCVELSSQLQKLSLQLTLLGCSLGRWCRQAIVKVPKLDVSVEVQYLCAFCSYQRVDAANAESINQVDDKL